IDPPIGHRQCVAKEVAKIRWKAKAIPVFNGRELVASQASLERDTCSREPVFAVSEVHTRTFSYDHCCRRLRWRVRSSVLSPAAQKILASPCPTSPPDELLLKKLFTNNARQVAIAISELSQCKEQFLRFAITLRIITR